MQFLSEAFKALQSPVGISIVGTLLVISETMGMSEKFKESSVLGAIIKVLKALKEKISPKA